MPHGSRHNRIVVHFSDILWREDALLIRHLTPTDPLSHFEINSANGRKHTFQSAPADDMPRPKRPAVRRFYEENSPIYLFFEHVQARKITQIRTHAVIFPPIKAADSPKGIVILVSR
jgi:hypothetical protein